MSLEGRYAWSRMERGFARVDIQTGQIVAEVHRATYSQYGPHTYGSMKFIDVESAKKACEKDYP